MTPQWGPLGIDELEKRLKQLPRRVVQTDPAQPRRAAVMLGLCFVDGIPSILFTKRADDVPTHKGQVSFPGGMEEPEDTGPVATALRETFEEVGLRPESIQVLGLLHDVRAITGVPVTPVLCYLGALDPSALAIDPRETAAAFTLSVNELCQTEHRHRVEYAHRGSYPVFESGPWPVWGLTAVMVDEFLREGMKWILWDEEGKPLKPKF